jgi:chemotaxis protein MotB
MAISSRRPRRPGIDIWPGFVDALSQLVMVIIFVLLVFTAGQFYLTNALSGRDAALERLTQQINELTNILALERTNSAELKVTLSQLTAQLQAALGERDALNAKLNEANANLSNANAQLAAAAQDKAARAELESKVTGLESRLAAAQGEIDTRDQRLKEAQSTVDDLNQQLLALRQQLAQIAAALDASEAKNKDQQVQLADLGRRLNQALASKVEELARYRSEFLGRLRAVLGDRPDIRVIGDRFVFQSEVLFSPGSADLSDDAKRQLAAVAQAVIDISAKIPSDINWVLAVDGYTDKRPINTPQFRSNWELSTARALSVVRYLVAQGVAPDRLAAAGFGEYQPIDPGDSEAAYRRNRRIELKLTVP